MQVKIGTYTGNGVDDRSISGVGFQPDLVVVIHDAASDAWGVQPEFRTSDNSGDAAFRWAGVAFEANTIQAIEADGFQVGTGVPVNLDGEAYIYLAIKDDASNTSAFTGFTGNGADSRNIVNSPAFTPTFTFVKMNSTQQGVIRHSSHAGDTSSFPGGAANAADHIQAFNADGFQVGTTQNVNGNLIVSGSFRAETGVCFIGSYTGNGTSQGVTGLGFSPQAVWIKNNTTTNQSAVFGLSNAGGGRSFLHDGGNSITNGITSYDADGFTVGANARVNTNNETYIYIAWREVVAPSPSGISGYKSLLGVGQA